MNLNKYLIPEKNDKSKRNKKPVKKPLGSRAKGFLKNIASDLDVLNLSASSLNWQHQQDFDDQQRMHDMHHQMHMDMHQQNDMNFMMDTGMW